MPMPRILPISSWRGRDHRQQHLDDPRRLLPGHAREHPLAVGLQHDEQQDVRDRRGGDPAGVDLVGVLGAHRRSTSGGGVSRTCAACSGVRPAARSPLSRARSARSTLSSVARSESPPRSTGSRVVSRVPSAETATSASPSSTAARAAASSGAVVDRDGRCRRPSPSRSMPSTRAAASAPATTTSSVVGLVAAEVGDDDDRGERDAR